MTNTIEFLKLNDVIIDLQKDFVAKVPKEIKNRQELFNALQDILNLPDYFGYNWDALSECLQDLSWIAQQRVIMIHYDIPTLEKKQKDEYIDILETSVRFWKNNEQHELLVVFP